ncbi:MAG: SDR family oxidoreductase [Acidimicrobiia bacterium]
MTGPRPVALVTGSSRGIGRATALTLARAGHDVVVHYRREAEAAEAVGKEVEASGVSALVVAADLQDAQAPGQLLAAVEERFGRLDVMVANAASSVFKPMLDIEPRHLDLTFRTVVQSFLLLAQGAVPLMAGRPGTMVAVSGIDTVWVLDNHGLLAAAKAALEQLVKYLAVELGPRDIAVSGVMPGYVDTASYRFFAENVAHAGPEAVEAEVVARTPAGRAATPEEIAGIIQFLTTPAGRWIRGQTIVTDGGVTLH